MVWWGPQAFKISQALAYDTTDLNEQKQDQNIHFWQNENSKFDISILQSCWNVCRSKTSCELSEDPTITVSIMRGYLSRRRVSRIVPHLNSGINGNSKYQLCLRTFNSNPRMLLMSMSMLRYYIPRHMHGQPQKAMIRGYRQSAHIQLKSWCPET